jgi:hypothetical protein
MKDRRRDPRIPVVLETMLQRGEWQSHMSIDVSRRGIFVLRDEACPVTQLLKLKIKLPREEEWIRMLAKVSRQVPAFEALTGDGLPGVGLEFFCLTGEALAKWDRFVQEARRIHDSMPDLDGYAVYNALEMGVNADRTYAQRPISTSKKDNHTNLIFRAHTMNRLEKFLDEDLPTGRFDIRIPYRLAQNARVSLRIIHPNTYEEFSLPGIATQGEDKKGITVVFDAIDDAMSQGFREFVLSGEAPPEPMEDICLL